MLGVGVLFFELRSQLPLRAQAAPGARRVRAPCRRRGIPDKPVSPQVGAFGVPLVRFKHSSASTPPAQLQPPRSAGRVRAGQRGSRAAARLRLRGAGRG